MVVVENTNKTFWIWSDDVDFVKRGDVAFWFPSPFSNVISRMDKKISDVAELSDAKFSPNKNKSEDFDYIDISNVDLENGSYQKTKLKNSEAPSRARKKLSKFDIAISTVRPNRSANVLILEDNDSLVCSTGFAVIKTKINPYYLFSYTKTPYFINQLVQRTSASLYPAVNEKDILEAKVFVPNEDKQKQVEGMVVGSYQFLGEARNEYLNAQLLLNSYFGSLNSQKQKKSFFVKWNDEIDLVNRIDPDFYSDEEMNSDCVLLGNYVDIAIGKTPAFDDYVENGKRILKFRAVTGNGLDWTNEERGFVKPSVASKNGESCIRQDDILFGCAAHQAHYIGSKIDIVDFIPNEFSEGVLTVAEVMRIRSKGEINPYVLLLFLRSEMGYQLIQKQVKGQTSHLYPKDVAQIKIPKQLLALSNSKEGKEIEEKLKSSIKKNRLSVEKLEEAKKFVENLIENK